MSESKYESVCFGLKGVSFKSDVRFKWMKKECQSGSQFNSE